MQKDGYSFIGKCNISHTALLAIPSPLSGHNSVSYAFAIVVANFKYEHNDFCDQLGRKLLPEFYNNDYRTIYCYEK